MSICVASIKLLCSKFIIKLVENSFSHFEIILFIKSSGKIFWFSEAFYKFIFNRKKENNITTIILTINSNIFFYLDF